LTVANLLTWAVVAIATGIIYGNSVKHLDEGLTIPVRAMLFTLILAFDWWCGKEESGLCVLFCSVRGAITGN
jgi:hypothetical protein